jgi:hypothetical protein
MIAKIAITFSYQFIISTQLNSLTDFIIIIIIIIAIAITCIIPICFASVKRVMIMIVTIVNRRMNTVHCSRQTVQEEHRLDQQDLHYNQVGLILAVLTH